MKKIGYLGPAGTFTEEAALIYSQNQLCQFAPYSSISELIYAVDAGEVDESVVPLENALEGTVNVTVDILVHEVQVSISGELVLPIHHCLVARPGLRMDQITMILSHPQALAQCRKYLHDTMGIFDLRAAASTAAAAREVSESHENWAAIATRRAAELFGLEILKADIEDHQDNCTRFVVLSRQNPPPSGRDKTSIAFTVNDQPGSLYQALKIFADHKVNLSKIESRPMRTLLGQYLFLVDMEGHCTDGYVAAALNELSDKSKFFKILGSYPRYNFPSLQMQET